MRYLLDTSVFLWALWSPERLNRDAWELLSDGRGEDLYFSAASAWEIGVKYALRKVTLPDLPARCVPALLQRWGIRSLDVTQAHALAVAELRLHHADPFDRMLAVQTTLEQMTLVTADRAFEKYGVNVLWCGT